MRALSSLRSVMMRNLARAAALAVSSALIAMLLVLLDPAAGAATSCGSWAPSGGILTARRQPGRIVIRTVFRFTSSEIQALRCTGSRSLEVDVLTYGGVVGGNRAYTSNVPRAYLDTEAFDSYPRVLTVGSDQASAIQPNVEYFTELQITDFWVSTDRPYAELYLNFQRGHKASITRDPENWTLCAAHGGSDPVWCNFPDESVPMKPMFSSYPRISLVQGDAADSVAWGSYRRSMLVRGDRLGVGDRIISPNNLNYLVMQSDGNLVEYIPGGRPVWATNTGVRGAVLVAQSDGNFVVIAPGNTPIWASGTGVAESTLELQNDRNVVVYAPGHRAIWANGAAGG